MLRLNSRNYFTVSLAMVMGGAIGFERQYKNRPAGMRTHI